MCQHCKVNLFVCKFPPCLQILKSGSATRKLSTKRYFIFGVRVLQIPEEHTESLVKLDEKDQYTICPKELKTRAIITLSNPYILALQHGSVNFLYSSRWQVKIAQVILKKRWFNNCFDRKMFNICQSNVLKKATCKITFETFFLRDLTWPRRLLVRIKYVDHNFFKKLPNQRGISVYCFVGIVLKVIESLS